MIHLQKTNIHALLSYKCLEWGVGPSDMLQNHGFQMVSVLKSHQVHVQYNVLLPCESCLMLPPLCRFSKHGNKHLSPSELFFPYMCNQITYHTVKYINFQIYFIYGKFHKVDRSIFFSLWPLYLPRLYIVVPIATFPDR